MLKKLESGKGVDIEKAMKIVLPQRKSNYRHRVIFVVRCQELLKQPGRTLIAE